MQTREAIFLGDNCPDTKINIIQINQNHIKVTCFRTSLEQIFTVHFWQKHKSRDNKRKEGVILSFSYFTTLLLKLIYQLGDYFKDLTRFIFKTLPNICDGEKPLANLEAFVFKFSDLSKFWTSWKKSIIWTNYFYYFFFHVRQHSVRKKCPYSELFWFVFSPNAWKYGPE